MSPYPINAMSSDDNNRSPRESVKQLDLRPYSKLYFSSRYMGAATLFRRFYGLPEDTVIPLSVAHGVDFGHCHLPMDVTSVEPIHWSCNPFMLQAARQYKPSILVPHPWVMHLGGRDQFTGTGVLVIGPPPSPENDSALHALIKNDIRDDWAILVKARGAYQASMRFWETVGLRPLTASGPDNTFYSRLADLLGRFDTIVGCTFSSALVFAASIGKRVRLLHGYSYRAYENAGYETEVNLASERARAVVRTFAEEHHSVNQDLSRQLLGFDQVTRNGATVRELRSLVSGLKRPFWNDPSLRIPYRIRESAAMALGKPKILRAGLRTYVEHVRRANICIMRINEFDLWLNGKNADNFSLTPTPYVRGVTEPGIAPGGYS